MDKETQRKIQRLYDKGEKMSEIARETGNPYREVYIKLRLRERGFKSAYDYYKTLAKRRRKRKPNRELSSLLNSRLKEIGKSRGKLAGEIGISKWGVCLYTNGYSLPGCDKLKRIYSALKLEKVIGLDEFFKRFGKR